MERIYVYPIIRFQNKLSEKKGEIAHTALLSFLKEFESHASNFNLHPEDLERRTSIFTQVVDGLGRVSQESDVFHCLWPIKKLHN